MANGWYGPESFAFEVIRVTDTHAHAHTGSHTSKVCKCGWWWWQMPKYTRKLHTHSLVTHSFIHSYAAESSSNQMPYHIKTPFIEQKIINAVSQRFFFLFSMSFLSFTPNECLACNTHSNTVCVITEVQTVFISLKMKRTHDNDDDDDIQRQNPFRRIKFFFSMHWYVSVTEAAGQMKWFSTISDRRNETS